jgi:recombination protein RecT
MPETKEAVKKAPEATPEASQSKTVATKLSPMDEVRGALMKMEGQFALALPSQIKSEKFTRAAITAAMNHPEILTADRRSFFSACMQAAQDGLLPDGREGSFVMFSENVGTKESPKWAKVVKWMPMIYGILKKVRNSGELSSIVAQIVYQQDVDSGNFRYWIDSDGEHIQHNRFASQCRC